MSRGEDDPHVPDALLFARLGTPRHSGWNFVAEKVADIERAVLVKRNDLLLSIGCAKSESIAFYLNFVEIDPVILCQVGENGMPVVVIGSENLHSPQNAV